MKCICLLSPLGIIPALPSCRSCFPLCYRSFLQRRHPRLRWFRHSRSLPEHHCHQCQAWRHHHHCHRQVYPSRSHFLWYQLLWGLVEWCMSFLSPPSIFRTHRSLSAAPSASACSVLVMLTSLLVSVMSSTRVPPSLRPPSGADLSSRLSSPLSFFPYVVLCSVHCVGSVQDWSQRYCWRRWWSFLPPLHFQVLNSYSWCIRTMNRPFSGIVVLKTKLRVARRA